jgi:hypothetical protein
VKAIIYSNRNQECERAQTLLSACKIDEVIVYYLDKDFTQKQFRDEFGTEVEYPQIAVGMSHIGGLKDTLHYLNKKKMMT